MKNNQYRESLHIGNIMCSKRQQKVQATGALTGKDVGREMGLQQPWNQQWLAIAKEKNAKSTINQFIGLFIHINFNTFSKLVSYDWILKSKAFIGLNVDTTIKFDVDVKPSIILFDICRLVVILIDPDEKLIYA